MLVIGVFGIGRVKVVIDIEEGRDVFGGGGGVGLEGGSVF